MTQSFFESTEGLFSLTLSNPPFSWRTDIKKLNPEHRLGGEMGSDNPGSDLAWHVQWVMTSIMASSYFLYVCAIVTAQGLRHRFSLNKTEEGSPRRHSKFLNLFSVVRWEAVINKRISQKLHERVSGSQIPGAVLTEASTALAIVKQSAGKGRAW